MVGTVTLRVGRPRIKAILWINGELPANERLKE